MYNKKCIKCYIRTKLYFNNFLKIMNLFTYEYIRSNKLKMKARMIV